MKKVRIFLILISLSLLSSACSLFDSLDEMGERQEELRDASQSIFNDQRQGATSAARATLIKCMNEKDCATSLSHKVFIAGRYYWAMEFQFWKNFMDDRWTRRLELLESGAKVYFLDMKEFIKNGDYHTIDPTKVTKNHFAALNAFAAQMHQVNISQKKAVSRAGGKRTWSVLDMVMEGLQVRNEINSGAHHQGYKHQVVYNEELAVYMLKLRYNFLSLLAVTNMGKLDRGGRFKVIMRLVSIIGKSFLGGSWSPDLADVNSEELKNWNEWLKYAIEARDFLRMIGEDAKLHWKVKKIYKTLELPVDGHPDFTDLEYERYSEFLELKDNLMGKW